MRIDPRAWILVAAIAAAAVVPVALARRQAGAERAPRELAVLGVSRAVLSEIEGHGQALAAAAVRLRSLETIPDEVLERVLAETSAVHAGFSLLLAGDERGIVIAARAGGGGASGVVRDAVDPSPERRAAMARALAAPSGGDTPWVAPGPDRIELGLVVRPPIEGEAGLYLGGDVSLARLEALLAELEQRARGRIALGLEGNGRALHPRGRPLPPGAWRSELGHGLVLHVAFAPARGDVLPLWLAGILGGIAALAAIVALTTRRPVVGG